MVEIVQKTQSFVDEYSRYLVVAWATFIGVIVRLIFDSKKKKITFTLFVTRYSVAVFVGWILEVWLKSYPKLDGFYGPIIAVSAVISYELVGIFINEVPVMFRMYFKRKFEDLEKPTHQE